MLPISVLYNSMTSWPKVLILYDPIRGSNEEKICEQDI